MPPGQDDNPFGAPRGAWGRQPPTTFGLSTPIRRPNRPSNEIRVPAPSVAPRNILTGGLIPRPAPGTGPSPAPPEITPKPLLTPPDATLVSDSVLARTSAAPNARVGGLPFPPVAGFGVVIAAVVVAGLLLLRHDPEPTQAPVATPETPTQSQPPAPVVAAEPVAEAPPAGSVLRTARSTPPPPPRRVSASVEAPAPITLPPLAAPPIMGESPVPAQFTTPAITPPADPEAPMPTRLPGPE